MANPKRDGTIGDVIKKRVWRSPGLKNCLSADGKIPSTGSRGQINADLESIDPKPFTRKDQKERLRSGDVTGEDIFLSMHYRAAAVQEIARRLGVNVKTVHDMLGVLYEETDRELLESPKAVRQEVGGMMLRWVRKFNDKIMDDTAEPHEIRAAIMVCEKLAKLTGANAPEEHEIRTFNVTANVGSIDQPQPPIELTAVQVLKDPAARDRQMQQEIRALQQEKTERDSSKPKRAPSRVLPGRVASADGATVSGAGSHHHHDDEFDEAGEP